MNVRAPGRACVLACVVVAIAAFAPLAHDVNKDVGDRHPGSEGEADAVVADVRAQGMDLPAEQKGQREEERRDSRLSDDIRAFQGSPTSPAGVSASLTNVRHVGANSR